MANPKEYGAKKRAPLALLFPHITESFSLKKQPKNIKPKNYKLKRA